MKEHYPLTDNGFKRVAKYLLIMPLREGLQETFSAEEQQLIKEMKEYSLAEKLVPKGISDAELNVLALFLLANSEVIKRHHPQLSKLLPQVKESYQQIVDALFRQYHLSLDKYLDLSEYFLQFLYQFHLRKRYSFKELEIIRSQRRIIKQFTSSLSLATLIYFELEKFQPLNFYDALFLDFVMHVYNIVCHIRNEYEPTNILVVNDGGKLPIVY